MLIAEIDSKTNNVDSVTNLYKWGKLLHKNNHKMYRVKLTQEYHRDTFVFYTGIQWGSNDY